MATLATAQHWRGSAPGKVLLFGEYGVLHGLPAAVVSLPSERLNLVLHFQPRASGSTLTVLFESALIPGGVEKLELQPGLLRQRFLSGGLPDQPALLSQVARALPDGLSRDARYIALALAPFDGQIPPGILQVQVLNAFSPALGFGSSSALLGLLHWGIWSLMGVDISVETDESFWMYLRTSLKLLQGGGSGYDVAVQLAASADSRPALWEYCWDPRGRGFAPTLRCRLSALPSFGLLLQTGVYSDTAQHVAAFAQAPEARFFAERHGKLAESFLQAPSPERAVALMGEARRLAFEQGILPREDGPLGKLVAALERARVPFKSTGAGHGDCLWGLTTRVDLEAIPDPLEPGQSLASRIRLDFEPRPARADDHTFPQS